MPESSFISIYVQVYKIYLNSGQGDRKVIAFFKENFYQHDLIVVFTLNSNMTCITIPTVSSLITLAYFLIQNRQKFVTWGYI